MEKMQRKVTRFAENVSEATTACLFTMVQGNILALTLSHLAIAAQTGIIAGVVASALLLFMRTGNRWVISVLLGIATAVVDYFVHPGQFGPAAMEAVVTGAGAAMLSYAVGGAVNFVRTKFLAQGAQEELTDTPQPPPDQPS